MSYQKEKRKKWSKEQKKREELRETFEMYDVDGSSAIDVTELRLMVNELCIPMTDEELNDVSGGHEGVGENLTGL